MTPLPPDIAEAARRRHARRAPDPVLAQLKEASIRRTLAAAREAAVRGELRVVSQPAVPVRVLRVASESH